MGWGVVVTACGSGISQVACRREVGKRKEERGGGTGREKGREDERGVVAAAGRSVSP